MRISDITLSDVKERLRVDYNTDDTQLSAIMVAAQAVIRDMTGRTDEEIDDFPQAYHLYMLICQHMYDNNEMTAASDKMDVAAQCIINQMKCAEVILQ